MSEREREKDRFGGRDEESARMTLNPTTVAPNPRYRGAKLWEKETQEREFEIERTKRERKRGATTTGDQGEIYRIYEEERSGGERA